MAPRPGGAAVEGSPLVAFGVASAGPAISDTATLYRAVDLAPGTDAMPWFGRPTPRELPKAGARRVSRHTIQRVLIGHYDGHRGAIEAKLRAMG